MDSSNTAPSASASSSQGPVFALVGNPNCGKSTLFNALTGLKQKIANYPGVTVERKEGYCYSQHGKKINLIDLPGTYSLNARSPDEAVVRDVLLGRRADTKKPEAILLVIDASNLERNLYLATQVLELGLPTIAVLNMTDVAESKKWAIDQAELSKRLGVPIVPIQASTGKGIVKLKVMMSQPLSAPPVKDPLIPQEILKDLQGVRADLAKKGTIPASASLLEPLYLISDHDPEHYGIAENQLGHLVAAHDAIEKRHPGWEDRLATARYEEVEKLLAGVLRRPELEETTFTDRLDRFLLHPFLGALTLISVMALMFYAVFTISEGPMGWIENGIGALSGWVEGAMPAGDLRDLMVNGVVAGVGGVVIFLPQILILFFFIGLMEDSGYMSRVAFLMDRIMGRVGLNGKSFVPFLSAYGCAVPGIMATRTIASLKDRIITILITPLASCSARLPVYSLMIAAMYPTDAEGAAMKKAGVMLSMYLVGTIGAFIFAWIFNRTLMKGQSGLMVLEMPTYKRPSLWQLLLFMLERAKVFIIRAGTVIMGLTIILWAAMTYPKVLGDSESGALEHSIAGRMGHAIEPVIEPLGFDWKIGIGMIASFAAREVFVSTMSIIYAVENEDEEDTSSLRERMAAEKWEDGSPVYTPLVCVSIMVFFVFAMQCLSTVAVVKRETNGWKWPMFQIVYMTTAAYIASLIVYQGGKLLGF